MATTTLFRPKRALSLPPAHNLSSVFLRLPAAYRSFHASPRAPFLETGVAAAHTLIEGLHASTGLPWVYTLPLAALAIRATCILPISIYARRKIHRQAALAPVVQSWQHVLRKETMRETGYLGPHVTQQKLLWQLRRKRSEIYKRWGCQVWKTMLPLVQLPVWLTAIEAVRAMCGIRTGLLGMILRSEKNADSPIAGIEKEASFATDGALWFPDLLVPDPQMILPFMLTGAVLLNLTNAHGGPVQSVWQRRLTNSFRVVALALGPLTLQVPAAMLVYWISSSVLAYIQAVILNRAMPMPPAVKPCKPRKPRGVLDSGAQKADR
jgi:mitochondrial inner membrane protein COX18